MMMHAMSVLTMDRFLAALSSLLTKAEAHCEANKVTPDAILQFDSYACDPRVVTQRGRSLGTSSLEAGRRKHGHRQRKSLRRLLYKAYWRRWMTKRLGRKLA